MTSLSLLAGRTVDGSCRLGFNPRHKSLRAPSHAQRQIYKLTYGVSTQQSSGLVAHENSTFRNLALAVSVPIMA